MYNAAREVHAMCVHKLETMCTPIELYSPLEWWKSNVGTPSEKGIFVLGPFAECDTRSHFPAQMLCSCVSYSLQFMFVLWNVWNVTCSVVIHESLLQKKAHHKSKRSGFLIFQVHVHCRFFQSVNEGMWFSQHTEFCLSHQPSLVTRAKKRVTKNPFFLAM